MRAGVRIGLYPDENESLDARGEGGKDLDLDFNFYSSEASKPVKAAPRLRLGSTRRCRIGRTFRRSHWRLVVPAFELAKLPLQISVNSIKIKRRSKENDDMVSIRKIL